MKFTIKVPAVGTFHGIFASAQDAQTWALACWPLSWPASVMHKGAAIKVEPHMAASGVACMQVGDDCALPVFAEAQLADGGIGADFWDSHMACAGLKRQNHEANVA